MSLVCWVFDVVFAIPCKFTTMSFAQTIKHLWVVFYSVTINLFMVYVFSHCFVVCFMYFHRTYETLLMVDKNAFLCKMNLIPCFKTWDVSITFISTYRIILAYKKYSILILKSDFFHAMVAILTNILKLTYQWLVDTKTKHGTH